MYKNLKKLGLFFKKVGLLSILLFLSFNVSSNHLYTSSLTYKKINEIDYEFTLEVITEINSNDTNNIGLNVMFYNSFFIVNQSIMNLEKIDTILCNYKKFSYKDTISLPYGQWIVFFRKSFRADVINLQNSYFTTLYNDVYIKNSKGLRNNSPTFNNEPIINICIRDNQLYPFLIEDSEKDSFVFEIQAVRQFINTPIPFFSNYNLSNPINADYFNLNTDNGDLTIITNRIGKFLISVNIKEFRKNELIGFYNKDLFIDVRDCQGFDFPILYEDYYEFCLNDSFNIIIETSGNNNPSIYLYGDTNLNIDSNKIIGLMNIERNLYVRVSENLDLRNNSIYHFSYNNFKVVSVKFRNSNLCSFGIININTSIRKQTIIYNLNGQVIFKGESDFRTIIKELPSEYKNIILFYRTMDLSEKTILEQGIFIKQ